MTFVKVLYKLQRTLQGETVASMFTVCEREDAGDSKLRVWGCGAGENIGRARGARQAEGRRSREVLHHHPEPGLGLGP